MQHWHDFTTLTLVEKRTKTLKVRVRDKHRHALNLAARQVNFVWNFVNELSHRSIKERGQFLSDYDFQQYTNGSAKELGQIGIIPALGQRQPWGHWHNSTYLALVTNIVSNTAAITINVPPT